MEIIKWLPEWQSSLLNMEDKQKAEVLELIYYFADWQQPLIEKTYSNETVNVALQLIRKIIWKDKK